MLVLLCTRFFAFQPRTVPRALTVARAQPWVAALEASIEKERRKRSALEKEQLAAEQAESLGRWAQLVVANLYMMDASTRCIEVQDWDSGEPVELRFSKSPRLEADEAFAKARRLRRGSVVVAGLLEKSTKRIDALALALDTLDLDAALQLGVSPPPEPPADPPKPTVAKKKWTGRSFVAPVSGVPILVGRNRRENDYLSCVLAKGRDVWMHVRNAGGAHVVLQLSKNASSPEHDDDLQLAANLAVFYSNLRHEHKALVTIAEPKHVWKPPRAGPGAVQIKKERASLLGLPDDVPADLIDLRRDAGGLQFGG